MIVAIVPQAMISNKARAGITVGHFPSSMNIVPMRTIVQESAPIQPWVPVSTMALVQDFPGSNEDMLSQSPRRHVTKRRIVTETRIMLVKVKREEMIRHILFSLEPHKLGRDCIILNMFLLEFDFSP